MLQAASYMATWLQAPSYMATWLQATSLAFNSRGAPRGPADIIYVRTHNSWTKCQNHKQVNKQKKKNIYIYIYISRALGRHRALRYSRFECACPTTFLLAFVVRALLCHYLLLLNSCVLRFTLDPLLAMTARICPLQPHANCT
jgi:hypothetical protein